MNTKMDSYLTSAKGWTEAAKNTQREKEVKEICLHLAWRSQILLASMIWEIGIGVSLFMNDAF